MPWKNLHSEVEALFGGLQQFDWQLMEAQDYKLRLDNDTALRLTEAAQATGPRGHMARQAALVGVEKRRLDPKAAKQWKARLSKATVGKVKQEDPEGDDNIAKFLVLGWTPRRIEQMLGHRRSRVLRVAKERGIAVASGKRGRKVNV